MENVQSKAQIVADFHKQMFKVNDNFGAAFDYLGHDMYLEAQTEAKLYDMIYDFVENTNTPKVHIVTNMLNALRVRYQDKKIKIFKDDDPDSFIIGVVDDMISSPTKGLIVYLETKGSTKEIPITLLTKIQVIEK